MQAFFCFDSCLFFSLSFSLLQKYNSSLLKRLSNVSDEFSFPTRLGCAPSNENENLSHLHGFFPVFDGLSGSKTFSLLFHLCRGRDQKSFFQFLSNCYFRFALSFQTVNRPRPNHFRRRFLAVKKVSNHCQLCYFVCVFKLMKWFFLHFGRAFGS